jgi:hypothetical protein
MGIESFDAAAVKRQFPGLADPQLHYLDSAATAQMPEAVLYALRRFEIEARANVHERMHSRARAASDAYDEARARVGRFQPPAIHSSKTGSSELFSSVPSIDSFSSAGVSCSTSTGSSAMSPGGSSRLSSYE